MKRREAGIFPFYSGMFPLLLLINLYRVYRQILSNHLPTLPWYPDAKKVNETPVIGSQAKCHSNGLKGLSLAGLWWPALSGTWILSLLIKKQQKRNVVLIGPLPAKLSGSLNATSDSIGLTTQTYSFILWDFQNSTTLQYHDHKIGCMFQVVMTFLLLTYLQGPS